MEIMKGIHCIWSYITPLRDSIIYPLAILMFNLLGTLCAGISVYDMVDYIVSLMILPIVVTVSDYIPPHIQDNYTIGSYPGMRRIAKVGVFVLVSHVIMFAVHVVAASWFYSSWVVQAPDATERASRIAYQVGKSICFLP